MLRSFFGIFWFRHRTSIVNEFPHYGILFFNYLKNVTIEVFRCFWLAFVYRRQLVTPPNKVRAVVGFNGDTHRFFIQLSGFIKDSDTIR